MTNMSKKKKITIISICSVIALAIIGMIAYFITQGTSETQNETVAETQQETEEETKGASVLPEQASENYEEDFLNILKETETKISDSHIESLVALTEEGNYSYKAVENIIGIPHAMMDTYDGETFYVYDDSLMEDKLNSIEEDQQYNENSFVKVAWITESDQILSTYLPVAETIEVETTEEETEEITTEETKDVSDESETTSTETESETEQAPRPDNMTSEEVVTEKTTESESETEATQETIEETETTAPIIQKTTGVSNDLQITGWMVEDIYSADIYHSDKLNSTAVSIQDIESIDISLESLEEKLGAELYLYKTQYPMSYASQFIQSRMDKESASLTSKNYCIKVEKEDTVEGYLMIETFEDVITDIYEVYEDNSKLPVIDDATADKITNSTDMTKEAFLELVPNALKVEIMRNSFDNTVSAIEYYAFMKDSQVGTDQITTIQIVNDKVVAEVLDDGTEIRTESETADSTENETETTEETETTSEKE